MSVPLYIPILMASLLALSAFFSASETALLSLEPIEVERRTRGRSLFADALGWCLANGRSVLVTILLSNLGLNVFYFALGGYWAGQADGLEATLVAVGAVIVLVYLAEVLPKSLALGMAGSLASWTSPLLKTWTLFVMPVVYPLARLLGFLAGRIGSRIEVPSNLTEVEVQEIVQRHPERFGLRRRTSTVVGEIFTLMGIQVREVMAPVVDLDPVPANTPAAAALKLAFGAEREWLLVESDGDVSGHVDVRDLLTAASDLAVGQLTRPFVAIPETARLHHLLALYRAQHVARVLVVDEYGQPAGVVGWDDLTESMVGGVVRSERHSGDAPVRLVKEGGWEVSGSLGVREFEEVFSVQLPLGRNRTIGGWIVDQLGALPQGGERVVLCGMIFNVLKASRGRVLELGVRSAWPQSAPSGDPVKAGS